MDRYLLIIQSLFYFYCNGLITYFLFPFFVKPSRCLIPAIIEIFRLLVRLFLLLQVQYTHFLTFGCAFFFKSIPSLRLLHCSPAAFIISLSFIVSIIIALVYLTIFINMIISVVALPKYFISAISTIAFIIFWIFRSCDLLPSFLQLMCFATTLNYFAQAFLIFVHIFFRI